MKRRDDMKRERGTGSLRLRGTIWWLRYFHNGKQVEESAHTSDEQQAKKLLRRKLKDADTERHEAPQARKVTIEDLADLIRADYVRRGNRSRVEPRLAHLLEAFAGWKALDITSERVERYLDARISDGAAIATANREAACLRHMFKLAVRTKLLPKWSTPDITLRPEDNVREGFLEPADLDPFLTALRGRDPVVADLAELAYVTLMRRANVLGLIWPMLDPTVENGRLVGGTLTLPGTRTKNKKPLTMPLTGRLLEVLDRRWQARSESTLHVFHRTGRPVRDFECPWRRAAAAIGQPNLTLHDFRRSGARVLIRAGVPEDIVMKMGGWKTRAMLSRYNIVDHKDVADAQAKLDAALAAPGSRKVVPLRRSS
jgi:integrase